MTLQEFYDYWDGKPIGDFNGDGYQGQCVDLAQRFEQDVIGCPITRANAKDWMAVASDADFEKIYNTPSNWPQGGDLVVWNFGTYGHIAIATNMCDVNRLVTLDANWPWGLDQNWHPCATINHDYTNVIGWLRPRALHQPVNPPVTVPVPEPTTFVPAEPQPDPIPAETVPTPEVPEEVPTTPEVPVIINEKENNMEQGGPVKGQLNKNEILSSLRGGIYTFLGVVGAQLLLVSVQIQSGKVDLKTIGLTLSATAFSILGNMLKKLFEGR